MPKAFNAYFQHGTNPFGIEDLVNKVWPDQWQNVDLIGGKMHQVISNLQMNQIFESTWGHLCKPKIWAPTKTCFTNSTLLTSNLIVVICFQPVGSFQNPERNLSVIC